MTGRPITLVSLTSKQIYEEQLKLKKGKIAKKKSLYIRGPSLRFFLVLMMMLLFSLLMIC
jgi:hypothetical protein